MVRRKLQTASFIFSREWNTAPFYESGVSTVAHFVSSHVAMNVPSAKWPVGALGRPPAKARSKSASSHAEASGSGNAPRPPSRGATAQWAQGPSAAGGDAVGSDRRVRPRHAATPEPTPDDARANARAALRAALDFHKEVMEIQREETLDTAERAALRLMVQIGDAALEDPREREDTDALHWRLLDRVRRRMQSGAPKS